MLCLLTRDSGFDFFSRTPIGAHVQIEHERRLRRILSGLVVDRLIELRLDRLNPSTGIELGDMFNLKRSVAAILVGTFAPGLQYFSYFDRNFFTGIETQPTVRRIFTQPRVDEIQQRLRELNIYQYFYPAPDQVVLGVADKGLTVREDIIQAINDCQILGHPLGDTEIVPAITQLPDLIDALSERGYLAEGEHGVEVSPAGQTTRMLLKYRPREGLISKLINRITVNANVSASIKDLLPPT